MTTPSLTDLGFDLETLRVDAAATVRALCERFEPEHANGLHLLLDAGEFTQRTVIGPPEADPRPHLTGLSPVLPEGCIEVYGFDEVPALAAQLSELGWLTAIGEVWDDTDEDTFADTGRTVLSITVHRTLRVSAAAPDEHPPRTALIERGQYLACACGTCDPNEMLRDPRALIERLQTDLDGLGAHRAERISRTLHDRHFPGQLRLLAASELERGDFLLFPQAHLHSVKEIRGDVQLSFCHGEFVTGRATRYLVHRPTKSAPVCDARSASFDPRYTAALEPSSQTLLERAALVCLTDLGLVEASTPVVTGAAVVGARE